MSRKRGVEQAPLAGKFVALTNPGGECKAAIISEIRNLGASFVSDFPRASIDYLIATNCGGKKFLEAVKRGVPVLQRAWLQKCSRTGTVADIGDFIFPPLQGCVIVVTGDLEDRDGSPLDRAAIKAMIVRNGGVYDTTLRRSDTTHLIAAVATGLKFTSAVQWGIKVVSIDWLLDSIEAKAYLHHRKYAIKAPSPVKKPERAPAEPGRKKRPRPSGDTTEEDDDDAGIVLLEDVDRLRATLPSISQCSGRGPFPQSDVSLTKVIQTLQGARICGIGLTTEERQWCRQFCRHLGGLWVDIGGPPDASVPPTPTGNGRRTPPPAFGMIREGASESLFGLRMTHCIAGTHMLRPPVGAELLDQYHKVRRQIPPPIFVKPTWLCNCTEYLEWSNEGEYLFALPSLIARPKKLARTSSCFERIAADSAPKKPPRAFGLGATSTRNRLKRSQSVRLSQSPSKQPEATEQSPASAFRSASGARPLKGFKFSCFGMPVEERKKWTSAATQLGAEQVPLRSLTGALCCPEVCSFEKIQRLRTTLSPTGAPHSLLLIPHGCTSVKRLSLLGDGGWWSSSRIERGRCSLMDSWDGTGSAVVVTDAVQCISVHWLQKCESRKTVVDWKEKRLFVPLPWVLPLPLFVTPPPVGSDSDSDAGILFGDSNDSALPAHVPKGRKCVCISGYEGGDERKDMVELVSILGGFGEHHFSPSRTMLLISNSADSMKTKAASGVNIPVVTVEWLHETADTGVAASFEQFATTSQAPVPAEPPVAEDAVSLYPVEDFSKGLGLFQAATGSGASSLSFVPRPQRSLGLQYSGVSREKARQRVLSSAGQTDPVANLSETDMPGWRPAVEMSQADTEVAVGYAGVRPTQFAVDRRK